MRERTEKFDFIKIKNLFSVKGNAKEWQDVPQMGKKIFAKDISDKELLSKIYKAPLKLNNN